VLTDVVPSKALIATADAANAVRDAGGLGIRFKADGKSVEPKVDLDLGAINHRC
jgi:dihydrolipoamide dehydrogenase